MRMMMSPLLFLILFTSQSQSEFIKATKKETSSLPQCAINMAEETADFYHTVDTFLLTGNGDDDRAIRVLRLMEMRLDDEALIRARDYVRETYSTDPVLMALMGVSLTMRQSTDLAEQAFQRASVLIDMKLSVPELRDPPIHIALKRIQASIHYMLGRVRWNLSDYENSILALEKASKIDSTIPELYEWMARSNDRIGQIDAFLSHWETALKIDPELTDRYVWPVYCVGLQVFKEHPVRDRLQDEIQYIQSKASILHDVETLNRFITRLRDLECDRVFIKNRNTMIRESIAQNSKYTWTNFAYGQVFFQGFHRAFTRPRLHDALLESRMLGLDFVSMGSNVGTESLMAATAFGVNVVGYDVMCEFVDIAQKTRFDLEISNAQFLCQDALKADVNNAAVVFIDNQAWDESLMNSMWRKLEKDLPTNALVFEYNGADYYSALAPGGPGRRWVRVFVFCLSLFIIFFFHHHHHHHNLTLHTGSCCLRNPRSLLVSHKRNTCCNLSKT